MTRTRAEILAEFYRERGETPPQEELDKCIQNELMEMDPEALPELVFHVKRRGEQRTNARIPLVACAVGAGKIWYMEGAATSNSVAHALMAALTDAIEADYQLIWKPAFNYKPLKPPDNPRVYDCRVKILDWPRTVHHVAAMDRSGELIVADRRLTLWRKIREKMSTPTLYEWGMDLIPKILHSGMITEATTFGMHGMFSYVLMPDAQEIFDELVGKYVRENGGIKANGCGVRNLQE